jgi:hypothetical protein
MPTPTTQRAIVGGTNQAQQYVVDRMKAIVGEANIRRMVFYDTDGGSKTLQDRSPNKQNATLSLPASQLDPATAGKARVLNFNAVGDFWEFADADDLSFGDGAGNDQAFSLVWCGNLNTTGTTVRRLIFKGSDKTGATTREYGFQIATNSVLQMALYKDGSNYLIRRNSTSIAGDVGSYNTYVSTYNGNKASSGLALYRNGTKIDDADANSGTYTGMANLGAKVGNYRVDTDGTTKADVTSAKHAFVAIIAAELTQTQVTAIDRLLRQYVGVL